jgi:hypothetical protein
MKTTVLCIALLTMGCQTIPPTAYDPRITHVVICWLKNPGDEAQKRDLITESKKLRTIPGVLDISAGAALPSTRPVVDSTYDVALVVTFRNQEDLNHYLADPRHQQLLKNTIRPTVDHYKVYDIADTGR